MRTVILLLFILFLMSCFHRTDYQAGVLMQADSLMQECPDSALNLLEGVIGGDLKLLSDKAKYALLLTQARDKNYILHKNDSLIRIAVNYYDSVGNRLLQAKSHYYLGRVYQDMKDSPAAIREFLVAMPLAKKSADHKLICMLYGNLGNIYCREEMWDRADSMYVRAERYSVKTGDSVHLCRSLMNRSDIYMARGDSFYGLAQDNLNRALIISKKLSDEALEQSVSYFLAHLYDYMGNASQSILFAKRSIDLLKDTLERDGSYLVLGDAYIKCGQYDSATIYLSKCCLSNDYYIKADAYKCFGKIAKKKGQLSQILYYKECYENYLDTAERSLHPIEVIESEKDVHMQQITQKYESFLASYRLYIYVGCSGIFILIFYFAYKRMKYHQQVNSLIQKGKMLMQEVQSCSIHLGAELKQKDNEISRLEELYDELKGDKTQLIQVNICLEELLDVRRNAYSNMEVELADKKAEIEALQRQSHQNPHPVSGFMGYLSSLNRESKNLIIALSMSSCSEYEKLLEIKKENFEDPDAKKVLEEEEWESLLLAIDYISGGFVERLNEKYECLLKDDVRFCCLVKIGFKYADIALFFNCTSTAVYKRKASILRRMHVNIHIKLEDILDNI